MDRVDRLTTLMERFSLSVTSAPLGEATLVVYALSNGGAKRMQFRTSGKALRAPLGEIVFAARFDWGGGDNPLVAALPDVVDFDLSEDSECRGLIEVMESELAGNRCGAGSVVSRLGEVLVVRMLRAQIESGTTHASLLAGLSDPRLSRAIVAMHDAPGRTWRNDELARVAGLSLSRFSELFLTKVGETPAAYLRRWRLILARQDVAKGDRVETISRRYGYRSPEGFARAFKKHFGDNPVSLRGSDGVAMSNISKSG